MNYQRHLIVLSLLMIRFAQIFPQPSSSVTTVSPPKPSLMLTPPKPFETRSPPKPSVTSTSPSPAPSPTQQNQPHDSILNILKKSGGFVILVKLLQDTHVANEINSQLADLNDGITFFAPTDAAFSELKAGMLNSLTGEQQIQLMMFHVVPTYLSTSQFQTVSNPLMTKAGGSGHDEFPLNVTTYGDKVVVFTGVNNASIESTVFSDGRLVIYKVGKVLLPVNIFKPGGSYTQTTVEEKPNGVATILETSGERRGLSGKVRNAVVGARRAHCFVLLVRLAVF